jgi:hypothetical protein
MPNRTSEANKAIALAWSKEQQLIRDGKGHLNSSRTSLIKVKHTVMMERHSKVII